MLNTNLYVMPLSNSELRKHIFSVRRTLPKGTTALISIVSNFRVQKIITLFSDKNSKHLNNTWPNNALYSRKFSRADSRVRMWRYSDVSRRNFVPIFRVFWWFGSTKPPAHFQQTASTSWRWGRSSFSIRRKTFGLSARKNFIEFFRRETFQGL